MSIRRLDKPKRLEIKVRALAEPTIYALREMLKRGPRRQAPKYQDLPMLPQFRHPLD
jgi:hypothetical protein